MKSPQRLIESSENDFERLLLRAGREHAPRGAKRRAILAATGAAAVVTTIGVGSAAGAAAAGKASATATTLLSLKWLVVVGVASVGVAAGTAAVHVVRAERAEAATVQAVAQARTQSVHRGTVARGHGVAPASLATVLSLAPTAVVPEPEPPPDLLPVAALAPVTSAVAPLAAASRPATKLATEAPRAAKEPAATLANPIAELGMLDEARAAIRGGQPQNGLAVLDDYAHRFPRGVMSPEASILRIEALVGTGDREAAKRAGEAFLRANPSSPYASRIDSLVSPSHP